MRPTCLILGMAVLLLPHPPQSDPCKYLLRPHSTLFTTTSSLEAAKATVTAYKTGALATATHEFWHAKKIVDSTLHPDTGLPVLLPFRMSSFVLSNLIVTGGMLTPGLGTWGTLGWQVANQSLNVCINSANANKSTPLSTAELARSYVLAVGASCSVALGLNAIVPRLKRVSPATRTILGRLVPFAAVVSAGVLNVFLMRGEEIRSGIDVYPISQAGKAGAGAEIDGGADVDDGSKESLGKSKTAAKVAVGQTALSRVINATPIMVIPPLILVRAQRAKFFQARPRLVMPFNLGLILVTSLIALPPALAVFPQRQSIEVAKLESWIVDKARERGVNVDGGARVEFNRGI